ncbi:hypothetical protein I316_07639 [Kwoniella heveanensis BCC8398]|uniref:Uncharacterized protein n=1 Tax=Kwoniella heveanensis BCC8398 TaxID=1296120 RepID=A0A1B9GI46_9TREE|nr:hypothetical protein I316_07639 [Kwoniella heveanensis BCC8398]
MITPSASLAALAPVLSSLIAVCVRAQAPDSSSAAANFNPNDPSTWPQWITNDYNCVINCLSGFSDQVTTIPQPDMEKQAFSCASSNCKGDGTGNYYQTLYYIQLFYATGSIYEWADSAPDGYKHAAFLDTPPADPSEAESQTEAQQSASDVLATASEPWNPDATSSGIATGGAAVVSADGASASGAEAEADAAETTGSGAGSGAAPVQSSGGAVSSSGGASHASSSSVKGATPTSGTAGASGSAGAGKNSTAGGNGTDENGNGSSGALPAVLVGLGAGVHSLLGLGVGVVVAGFGGVWLGV